MGQTRFPNGVEVGDSTNAATLSVGGTAINPVPNAIGGTASGKKIGALAGTVVTGSATIAASAFGLSSVTTATASITGTATGWGGTATGDPFAVKANVSGGSVVVRVYDSAFAAAANAGTVAIIAYGT